MRKAQWFAALAILMAMATATATAACGGDDDTGGGGGGLGDGKIDGCGLATPVPIGSDDLVSLLATRIRLDSVKLDRALEGDELPAAAAQATLALDIFEVKNSQVKTGRPGARLVVERPGVAPLSAGFADNYEGNTNFGGGLRTQGNLRIYTTTAKSGSGDRTETTELKLSVLDKQIRAIQLQLPVFKRVAAGNNIFMFTGQHQTVCVTSAVRSAR